MVQSSVDDGIAAFNETAACLIVAQPTRHPLDLPLHGLDSAPVAAETIPAAANVPR
jgi:hypothetical protein